MPLPYIGKRFEQTHEGEYVFEYSCRRCEFETDVAVQAKGWGGGSSPFFIDNDGAEQDARLNAQGAAAKNARITARLLACPRCDKRDSRAIFLFILSALFKICLVTLPLVLFGNYFLGSREFEVWGWFFIGIGFVLGGSLYFTLVHPRWAGASKRSRFRIAPTENESTESNDMKMQTEIFLSLKAECIQTASKRLQRTLASLLLDDDQPDPDSQAKYELVTAFLEQGDFSRLRTDHVALAGGQDVEVRIFRVPGSVPEDDVQWEIVRSEGEAPTAS